MTTDVLSGDTDVPILPVKYHDLIVYRALTEYGVYEESQEVTSSYGSLYGSLLQDMLWQELDEDELPCVVVV